MVRLEGGGKLAEGAAKFHRSVHRRERHHDTEREHIVTDTLIDDEVEFGGRKRQAVLGECSRLPKLRSRRQPRGVGLESNNYRNCYLSELRLVWSDRNTNHRSGAS